MAIRVRAGEGEGTRSGQRSVAHFSTVREITIDESLAAALALTESDIDVLRDPFTERLRDVYRASTRREGAGMRAVDSYEVFG